jgi:hypothetical protein
VYGKANEFPLVDEATRCSLPTANLANEAPRLLDPCHKDDCELLAHGTDGELKPRSPGDSLEYHRAEYTIRQLGLNGFNAPENKKKVWRTLDALIRLAGNNPEVVNQLQEHLSDSHEYSSYFKSAIGTHRDKLWVEALLN